MKKTIFILFLLLLAPTITFAGDYRIEDVQMTEIKRPEGGDSTLFTRGMVRNMGNVPIKGYADVDYLNANGDVVYNMSAGYANKDREIPPGKARFFEHYISSRSAPGAVGVKVEFIIVK